jgi:spermidine/putrescine transport system substrate-binding protein
MLIMFAQLRAEMEMIAPELANSPYIFPDDAMSAKLNVFRSLTPAEESAWSEAFQKAQGN